jgi:AraC-like DNA-binding protein
VSDIGRLHARAVPWHWHDDLEIAVITEGSSIIRVNDATYRMHAGDGYFMNRNVLHSQELCGSDVCQTTTLIFSPSIFSGGVGSKFYMDLVQPILLNTELDFVQFHKDVAWEQNAIDCIRQIHEVYTDSTPWPELLICASLARFWHLLLSGSAAQRHTEKSLSIRDRNRIKTMISFIETHFAEPITLADIAAAASISPRECTRCFKSIISDSPVNYLMKHRISAAADMLLHTDCTVTDAAMRTGFENLSYFAKIFKRIMNITPKHYQLQDRN